MKLSPCFVVARKEQLMDTPKFFTIEEAASILRVSKVTIHRKLSSGEIRATRLGKRVLIPAVWFESLIAKAAPETADNPLAGK
jgi:excisionase family DNA binding protein